jgi:hypothetical protein
MAVGLCNLPLRLHWAEGLQGRVPPMASLRDSRGSCGLHEAVIGQLRTFSPVVMRTLERLLQFPNGQGRIKRCRALTPHLISSTVTPYREVIYSIPIFRADTPSIFQDLCRDFDFQLFFTMNLRWAR